MRTTLQELYYGNINPNEKKFKRNSLYGSTLKKLTQVEDRLNEILSDEGKTLLEKFSDYQSDLTTISNQESFVDGFRLGMKIVTECFYDSDGDIIDII